METGKALRLADVFVTITDPRQAGKVEHDLVELLVVAVNAVLVGADTFVEIELWAKEKLDWLRHYLKLEHGIASHDTFGRLFGLIDPEEFETAFRRWVRGILPALGADMVVAIAGKTSRRSGKVGAPPCIWSVPLLPERVWSWGNAPRRRSRTRRPRSPNCFPPWPRRAVSSPSTPWALRPISPKPSGNAVPIMFWRQKTISRRWPTRFASSSRPSKPVRRRRHITWSKRLRKIMAGLKFAAALSSTNSIACTSRSSGLVCLPSS